MATNPTPQETQSTLKEGGIEAVNAQSITNPTMPAGSEYSAVEQEAKEEELTQAPSVDPDRTAAATAIANAAEAQSPETQEASQATATTVDPSQAETAEAAQGEVSEGAQMEAAQGQYSDETMAAFEEARRINEEAQLSEKATVQGQYEDLTDFEAGEIPAWAKGAVKEAEQRMAARGLGSSSIAAGEITGSILKAAMPIAQQDAQIWAAFENKKLDNQTKAVLTKAGYLADMDMQNLNNRQQAAVQNARAFLEMDLSNLQNEQQAAMVNAQGRQQQILSNQSARNAAENLNVQSENQMKQFMANLTANVDKFNAQQKNAIEQFNAGESNAMAKFNSELENMREQFNVENQIMNDQFNAQYLRQISTRNTEAQNRANYVNSQNLLNISNSAMANAITLLRDREAFAFKASENAADRAENRAIAAMNNDANMEQLREQLDAQSEGALYEALGGFVGNIGTEIAGSIDWNTVFGVS